MPAPADCRYKDTHEWHRLDQDNLVTIGITRFAVDELTDVTFVQLPSVGAVFKAGDAIGEIESVKATSDLYTGVSGKVVQINRTAVDNPAIINADPQGDGWLIRLEASSSSELDKLMDAQAYNAKYPTA